MEVDLCNQSESGKLTSSLALSVHQRRMKSRILVRHKIIQHRRKARRFS